MYLLCAKTIKTVVYFFHKVFEHRRRANEAKGAEHLEVGKLCVIEMRYEAHRRAGSQYQLEFVEGLAYVAFEAQAEYFEKDLQVEQVGENYLEKGTITHKTLECAKHFDCDQRKSS